MSVYSGFATRNQQQCYDKILYNLISALMTRVLKSERTQSINNNAFIRLIKDHAKVLLKMEKRKPKYGELVDGFARSLNGQLTSESITQPSPLNRTLSLIGKQFEEISTRQQQPEQINPQKAASTFSLEKINQIKHKRKTKKTKKKVEPKSFVDLFDLKNEKLPTIPNLYPTMTVDRRTSRHSFKNQLITAPLPSQQLNKKINSQRSAPPDYNQAMKIAVRTTKYRAKLFLN